MQSEILSPYSRLGSSADISKTETLLDAGYYHIKRREVERSEPPITLTPHSSTKASIQRIATARGLTAKSELRIISRESRTFINEQAINDEIESRTAEDYGPIEDEEGFQEGLRRAEDALHYANTHIERLIRDEVGDIAYLIRLKPGQDVPEKWKKYSTFTILGDNTRPEQHCILVFPGDKPVVVSGRDWGEPEDAKGIESIETLDFTPELEELNTLEYGLHKYGKDVGRVSLWIDNLGLPAGIEQYIYKFVPQVYQDELAKHPGLEDPLLITERNSRNRGDKLIKSYLAEVRRKKINSGGKTATEDIFDRTGAIIGGRLRPEETIACANGALVMSAPSIFGLHINRDDFPSGVEVGNNVVTLTRYLRDERGQETGEFVDACAVRDAAHLGSCIDAGYKHIISLFDKITDGHSVWKARDGAAIEALLAGKEAGKDPTDIHFRYTIVSVDPTLPLDAPGKGTSIALGSDDFQTKWPSFTEQYKGLLEHHTLTAIDIKTILNINEMALRLKSFVPATVYNESGFKSLTLRGKLREWLKIHTPVEADFTDDGELAREGFSREARDAIKTACDAIVGGNYYAFLEAHNLSDRAQMQELDTHRTASRDLAFLDEHHLLDERHLPRAPLTYEEITGLLAQQPNPINPLRDGERQYITSYDIKDEAEKAQAALGITLTSPSTLLTMPPAQETVILQDNVKPPEQPPQTPTERFIADLEKAHDWKTGKNEYWEQKLTRQPEPKGEIKR